MREGQFIKKNLPRWEQYQQPTQNPDRLAKNFTYLVDDLGYAKTFYPHSNIVKYINAIAAGIYLDIYKNKKENKQRLLHYWTDELPLILYKHRATLLFALALFLLFVGIGLFSAYVDQRFIRAILGSTYVEMTENNIAKGRPFDVYSNQSSGSMFIQIALNNIRVAVYCFVVGILFAIPTVYMIFKNGVMVGVFEAMFFQHHLGVKSILVIFTHGTLELSAIVIAGAAGLVMGQSLLFPKTFTRLASFKDGAKDGLKMLVSLLPIFIVAAFFESYVTRHTQMPLLLNIAILAASASFMVWYYVLYPIQKHKQMLTHGSYTI